MCVNIFLTIFCELKTFLKTYCKSFSIKILQQIQSFCHQFFFYVLYSILSSSQNEMKCVNTFYIEILEPHPLGGF